MYNRLIDININIINMNMTKKVLCQTFNSWLPFAIVIVIFSGLVYVAVQQNYRMSANEPLYQIVETVTNGINQGQPLDQIVPAQGTAELSGSVLPFAMIYNATSTLIGSSALLDGKNPSVPSEVLDTAKARGQYAVTWQPKPGVREAIVVKYFSGPQAGFLVAGRSLKQTEILENQTLLMSAMAGIIALVLTFIMLLFFVNKSIRPERKEEISLELKITESKDAPKSI